MATTNYGYNTPAKGSTDWDVPLNENFTDIDGDIKEAENQPYIYEGGTLVGSGTYEAFNFVEEVNVTDAGTNGDGRTQLNINILNSVVTDGDGVDRQIWVIANGAADPAGAGANDIIFEANA